MRAWLEGVLESGRHLTEEAEGYLLGRAMRRETIHRLGMSLWTTPANESPDDDFNERYKVRRGRSYLDDRLVCPVLSPRGDLIGFEARTWQGDKYITDYRLPEADWNPFFIGLVPETMEKVWNGGDVWIVEHGAGHEAQLESALRVDDTTLPDLELEPVCQARRRLRRRREANCHDVHAISRPDRSRRPLVEGR